MPGMANEDPGLGTGEKTLLELLVEGGYALLEGKRLAGELGGDRGGDALGRQGDVPGLGRGERLLGEGVRSLDGAVPEEGAQTLASGPPDPRRGLVVGHQGQGPLVVQVEGALQGGKQRNEGLPETGDGAGLVRHEVAAAGEQEAQLGEVSLAGSELAEIRPHPGLLGDDAGVAGIGFGLPAVGVAGPVHGQPGEVDDPLVPLPQERQQEEGRAAPGLVDGPNDFPTGEGESLVDEGHEGGLVVLDPSGEKFGSRGVEQVGPVELLTRSCGAATEITS